MCYFNDVVDFLFSALFRYAAVLNNEGVDLTAVFKLFS